ncbi:MAG TPA: nitrilase, partial [Erythrobacter sp.]|nr:nitrilase [Erythrobacter sp.]HCI61555.1 nitrilase [Erythrobacter sp.]
MARVAVLQMTSGIDPGANAAALEDAVAQAAAGGADMLFTPEMSGLLDRDRERASRSICSEDASPVLARVREAARKHGLWVSLGSLALEGGGGGEWVNRAFVIAPDGTIAARYDK